MCGGDHQAPAEERVDSPWKGRPQMDWEGSSAEGGEHMGHTVGGSFSSPVTGSIPGLAAQCNTHLTREEYHGTPWKGGTVRKQEHILRNAGIGNDHGLDHCVAHDRRTSNDGGAKQPRQRLVHRTVAQPMIRALIIVMTAMAKGGHYNPIKGAAMDRGCL